MKEIRLTNGSISLVDDEDFEYLSQFTWTSNHGYAQTNMSGVCVKMHRLLMNAPKRLQVDHINRDKLDNRKSNLRLANQQENCANRGYLSNNKLGVKGVHEAKDHYREKRFRASIRVNKKLINLGYYLTPEEAAKAYNEAAVKYFGEFAGLNILEG